VWSKKNLGSDNITKNVNLLIFLENKLRAQVHLKKIQNPNFGKNNSQDKWLLPCPIPSKNQMVVP
jgi:hypothetical protein